MEMWKILGIEATSDIAVIKKAYHKKLKVTRPDDDEEAFMNLRDAYERALIYAENAQTDEDDDFEWDDDETEAEDFEFYEHNGDEGSGEPGFSYENMEDYEFSPRYSDFEGFDDNRYYEDMKEFERVLRYGNLEDYRRNLRYIHREGYESADRFRQWQSMPSAITKYLKWVRRTDSLYNDYDRRNQVSEWKELLYNDIPYELEYYKFCRKYIYDLIYVRYNSIYLPREVRLLLDDFFSYGKNHLERAKLHDFEKRYELSQLNIKLKLCESIQFDRMNAHGQDGRSTDDYFYRVEQLIEELPVSFDRDNELKQLKMTVDSLMNEPFFYLPVQCLHIFVHFDEYTCEENQEKISGLANVCNEELSEAVKLNGEYFEIKLLRAKSCIQKGNIELAGRLLKELYMEAPLKDYLSLYMLMCVLKEAEMYYEAYMIIKQLTWLKPQEQLYIMADEVCKLFEEKYQAGLRATEDSDMEEEWDADDTKDADHIRMCRIYLRSNREKDAAGVLARVKNPVKNRWEYEVAHAMCIFYEDSVSVPSNIYVVSHTEEPEPVMELEKAKPVFEILNDYPKEALSNIDRLEWQELQGRYLFEQRRYDECIEHCNELLEHYPGSYPVLTLRVYADFNARVFGKNARGAVYPDLTYLLEVLPQRKENRLVAAQLLSFNGFQEEATEVMEPVKEILPDHYKFCKIYSDRRNSEFSDEEISVIREIFTDSRERELDIPPVSKYRLPDLKNIFVYACYRGGSEHVLKQHKELYLFLESLKDAKYNHPELYMEMTFLYCALDMREKAGEVAESMLENATEHEKKWLYWRIGVIYVNNLKKLKKYDKYMNDLYRYGNMGCAASLEGDHELAVELLEKAERLNVGRINLSQILAYSYCQLGRYEDAINAQLHGIKKYNLTGDSISGLSNSYLEIAEIYMQLKEFDKAFEYAQLAKTKTKSQICLAKYNEFYARFIVSGLAYEYYLSRMMKLEKEGKKPTKQLVTSTFMAAYVLRKPEAKHIALTLAFYDGNTDIFFLIHAARASFMETQTVDRALAEKIDKTLGCFISPEAPAFLYACLAEINMALGNEERVNKSIGSLFKRIKSWEEAPDTAAWMYAYMGKYEKALGIYSTDDDNKNVIKKGISYAEYKFFKDMVDKKKG